MRPSQTNRSQIKSPKSDTKETPRRTKLFKKLHGTMNFVIQGSGYFEIDIVFGE